MPHTVTVVGSYNVGIFTRGERLPGRGETVIGDKYWVGGGGKGSNQAVAASRLGAETRLIAAIGDDDFGAAALAMYRRFGIGTEAIRVHPGVHTGVSVILVDGSGANLIMVVPGANYRLSEADIDAAEATIAQSKIVGFQLENDVEVVAYGIRRAHGLGAATLLDPAPATPLPHDLYGSIDYIKPNETEATILTGIPVRDVDSAAEAGRWLVGHGTGTAIVTLGAGGAVLVRKDLVRHFPALAVEAVDSTGAGDVFSGGLMAALARGEDVQAAVAFANRAAGISVTRLGVIDAIPEAAEVLCEAVPA